MSHLALRTSLPLLVCSCLNVNHMNCEIDVRKVNLHVGPNTYLVSVIVKPYTIVAV